MHHRHQNHEELFKRETERGDKFQRWYKELEEPFLKQKDELHKLKLEVIKYEQRYGFVDVNKLHEQVAEAKTAKESAETRSDALQHDLFELRERIMDTLQKLEKSG